MGIGTTYASTVGYPNVGEWTHIVATWTSDGVATLYRNGGDSAGGSQQTVSVAVDSGSQYDYIGLNGLYHYNSHTVIGCFAQVQLVNRALTAEEVTDLYIAFAIAMNTSLMSQSVSHPLSLSLSCSLVQIQQCEVNNILSECSSSRQHRM